MPHPLWPGLCRGTGLLLRSWTRTSLCSPTARPGPRTCCPHQPPDHAPGLSFSVTQNLSCCRYSVSLTPPHFFTAPSSNSNNHMFQFSCSVLSDSLQPHGLQHTRLPCPSPTPGACLNSCPSHQWYHPAISSSVIPFSSCLQSCPTSGSFPMSKLFESGGQSMGASVSASILSMSIQS